MRTTTTGVRCWDCEPRHGTFSFRFRTLRLLPSSFLTPQPRPQHHTKHSSIMARPTYVRLLPKRANILLSSGTLVAALRMSVCPWLLSPLRRLERLAHKRCSGSNPCLHQFPRRHSSSYPPYLHFHNPMPWSLCLNLTPVCPAATHHPFPPSPPSLLSAVLLKCLTLGLYLLALIQRNGWATSETTSSNGLITYTGHWGLFVVHFEGLYKAGGVEARYTSTEAISGWASVAGGNNTVLHKVGREGGGEEGNALRER